MQDEQIIYNGHTPGYVWDALEKRSNQTLRKVTLRCPVCDTSIHHTETPQRTPRAFAQRDDTHETPQLRCRSCDAPASVFQHSHHTETADTRIIYIEVKGQSREVARLNLCCLSCGESLTPDETCTNTCWIQTYLCLEIQDAEPYIKRWLNCLEVKRDIPEIPMRLSAASDAPETDTQDNNETQPLNIPPTQTNAIDFEIPEHPHPHTDIAGQILAFLKDAPNQTATTSEMRTAIGCTPGGFNKAVIKLQNAGRIRKVERGVYALRDHT